MGHCRAIRSPWRSDPSQGAETQPILLDGRSARDFGIQRDVQRRRRGQEEEPRGGVQVLWRLVCSCHQPCRTLLTFSGGCQFQPMPYEQQLLHKKRTLELAYARYSRLPADVLPPIQDTIPSPKQWNYRTKITPHFDAMPKWLKRGIEAKDPTFVQGEDGVWRGMVDVEDRTKTKGGKGGKRYKPGFGLAKPVPTEEDAMNGQEGKPVEEAEAPAKKEKRWKLDIGFEGKGGVGVLDIEVRGTVLSL
jgi:hypothetical protein